MQFGCALRIKQHGKRYSFHYNSRYCLNKGSDGEEAFFKSLNKWDVAGYIEAFPVILGVVRADDGCRLIVFENKFGNGAISGAAGPRRNQYLG